MQQEPFFVYLREKIDWAFSCDTKTNVLDAGNIVSSAFGSRCLVAPWAFSQTPIVQAVNQLDDHEKTLVKFVVGLSVTHEEIVQMMVPLWAAFYQEYLVFHRLNSSSVPKAQRLLEFALMNYQLSVADRPLVISKKIMEAIDVSESKYSRDWKPRLRVMSTVIAKIEHAALKKVARCINNKRQEYA